MKRRTFNRLISSGSMLVVLRPFSLPPTDAAPIDRIGMSTVNFRNRFPNTRPEGIPQPERELTLLQVPEYFRDRFSIRNVEFWSKHFDSIDKSYLKALKAAIKKTGSRLINIQLDESYQLGSQDPAKRKESLELVLRWVKAAKILGAGAIRVNPGQGDLNHVIDSLKIINKLAQRKGIVLMTENHFGMEMDPEVHLKIVKEVGRNMYTLPDFGNYSEAVRFEALKKILPYAYQVSVKTVDFDENLNHLSFDFDRCMEMVEESGFKGIYSVEQWSPNPLKVSDESVADWMIARVKPYCK